MKYFLDTEFIEAPNHLDLISIGIVCDSGEVLYCENSEVDWSKASPWVLDNVKPHLSGYGATKAQIAAAVIEFIRDNDDGSPTEFWGYYADYDWVALCWLFGTMMDLPKGFPMFCMDIKQWAQMLGNPKLPEQGKGEHHALADAHWNKTAWDFLNTAAQTARAAALKEAVQAMANTSVVIRGFEHGSVVDQVREQFASAILALNQTGEA